MATIVVDAGHGGYDPGAVNGTRYEKDDNLRMASAIAAILRDCGQRVIMTRDSDVFLTLSERARISNNANADLFISLHRNSNANTSYNGWDNFVKPNASARERQYAQTVIDSVAAVGIQNNRGVQTGNFTVLTSNTQPAMLLEMGFLSNAEDNRLFDTKFQDYSQAIASGIMSALGIYCAAAPPVSPPATYPDDVVRSIQESLNSVYDAGLTADGIAGPATRRALVRALQIQLNAQYNAGLATDGVFGSATRAAIRALRQGDRGNLVWILQAALYVNGFRTIPDGIFGANTAQEIRNFQVSKGLTADGIAGPNTFAALMGGTAAATNTGTVVTAGGNLNMRSAPSAAASIIAKIPNGSRVQILGTNGNFYQVSFNGRTGWVSRDFIRV